MKFIFLSIFLSANIYCQNSFDGKVIDDFSLNPILGAHVSINEKKITFSDDEGNFQIDLLTEKIETNTEICFSHISYQKKCIKLKEFLENSTVKLSIKSDILNEVIIVSKTEKFDKKFIKETKKLFKDKTDRGFYWSEINLKQVTSIDRVSQNYLEVDGYIFMIDKRKEKNLFKKAFIIPKQVRRTEETQLQKKSHIKYSKKTGVLQHSAHSIGENLPFLYRVYENLHPLGNKSRKYNFEFLTEEEIDNETYLVYEFNSRKDISDKRTFSKFYGKLWLHKTTKTLFKEETSFHFEDLQSITMQIQYKEIDDVIYPKSIKSSVFSRKTRNLNIEKTTSSLLTFTKIDTKRRENYWDINGNGNMFFVKDFNYNKDYWKEKNLVNNPFYNKLKDIITEENEDELFIIGTSSAVYDKQHKSYKTLYPLFKEKWNNIIKVLERDLEIEYEID